MTNISKRNKGDTHGKSLDLLEDLMSKNSIAMSHNVVSNVEPEPCVA